MSRDVSADSIVVPATPNPHVVDSVPKAVAAICVRNAEVVAVMGLGEGTAVAPEVLEDGKDAMEAASPSPSPFKYAVLPNLRDGDALQDEPYALTSPGTSRWTEMLGSNDLWCGLSSPYVAHLDCCVTPRTDGSRTARMSRSRTIWPPSPISSPHLGWPTAMKLSRRRRR